jgi:Calcineurin-like phosphoesterase
VRTLVISDLHLGAASGADVLRRPELREPLVAEVREADRLVILGDGVELRDRPQRDVAEVAGSLYADLGRALGPEGELIMVAGNHDHGLVGGWLDARLITEPSGFLGLEQRLEPAAAGPLAAMLAAHAAPARVGVAYPGLWLREDVFALHGHYGDLHSTVPTFERLAAGAMARFVARLPADGATVDDYEAVLAPIYAWLHALTQRRDATPAAAGAQASARAWVALAGSRRGRRDPRILALAGGYVAGVTVLNALGIGPLDRRLSGDALRRGGLHAIREVLRRLGIEAPHVVWGHSHRPGPLPADDPAEWRTAAGGHLHNTGSWVFQPHFVAERSADSPYWPGTAVVVEDHGPPRLVRLLAAHGRDALSAGLSRGLRRSPA